MSGARKLIGNKLFLRVLCTVEGYHKFFYDKGMVIVQ